MEGSLTSTTRPATSVLSTNDVDLSERLDYWRRTRNWVEVGNLGEQVTLRLLESLDYQVLGTQDDYLGMVTAVLGDGVTAHPEDFIAIDPQGRLLTVNSKATASPRTCRVTRDGQLTAPRIGRVQKAVGYSTERANLVSPLDGDSYAQVVKVDLLNLRAQVFDIEVDGRLTRLGDSIDIAGLVATVLAENPHSMPPPTGV